MVLKRFVVVTRILNETHDFFSILKDVASSFGYETVVAEDHAKALLYLEEADFGILLCDDSIAGSSSSRIQRAGDKISVILLVTGTEYKLTYDSTVDYVLILGLPPNLFEQTLFNGFRYVELKRKLSSISGVVNPDFIKKLLSDTAHTINNILTGMQGYAELAQLNPGDERLIRDAFQVVLDSSYRVRNEIKNLRAFARVENPVSEPVDIGAVLDEAIGLNRNLLRVKDVKLDLTIKQKVLVSGDSDQLEQVFFNLLNDILVNIMDRGGLDLVISDLDGMVLTTMSTGSCDISDAEVHSLRRVFALDVPVLKEDSREGRLENRNILSLCSRIIRNHRGMLGVEKKDDVLTYTVSLPLLERVGKSADDKKETLGQPSMNVDELDMDILIVDDEEYVRNTMYYFFDQRGCRVTLAEDGEFGYTVATQKPFDLIFMDYMMPKMGGVESARNIMQSNPEAKIVFITGRETIDEDALYRSGIYGFVKKPFEMKDLYDIAIKVAMQKGIVG